MFSKKETQQQTTTTPQVKSEQAKAEYHVAVCVKDTNQENGPGHVTALLIKKKEGKTEIRTTSFYPGFFGSIVNGLTFGSIPVSGQLATDHKQDVEEATHILTTQVTKDQFKGAKKGQNEFTEDVIKGHSTYSVFADANPLVNGFKHLLQGASGSQRVVEKTKKETGCHPLEDVFGFPVYDDNHPEVPEMKVDNCASSVTHVIKGAGFKNFENPNIPTLFTPALEKHGFTKVDKDSFIKEYCRGFKS
ncbi:hypothetical protein OQJ13_00655 [Legionella sp. PATHC035]|uniref:hypothetical protein n=1 Tax=Legionella sp. PATHC035 TaxID=2992040 RepID=UPI002242E226|nr:hypothetical protein [Legionella sp. PATHC035]MCW8407482.1 hypothetical protein [Legionella sp. PATHC035]